MNRLSPPGVSAFPGATYGGSGRSLDRRRPDLTVARMARYQHRGVVSRSVEAECIRVWCLADEADFESVQAEIMNQAIEFVLSGTAILLLGKRAEVVAEFREMMLAAVLISENLCRQRIAA